MDGAFVVARDGTVEAACRLIDAPDDRADAPQGPGHAALGRRRDHRRHQGPGRRRQPVQRHRPALPGRRDHPPDRPDAPRPRHEVARRRDRAAPPASGRARREKDKDKDRDRDKDKPARRSRPTCAGAAPVHREQIRSLHDRVVRILVEPLYRLIFGRPLRRCRLEPTAERKRGRPAARAGWCWWPTAWAGWTLRHGAALCDGRRRPALRLPGLSLGARVRPLARRPDQRANRDPRPRCSPTTVRQFRAEQPDDPVFLVAKSGGRGWWSRRSSSSTKDSVERAILLAPALSPDYDLTAGPAGRAPGDGRLLVAAGRDRPGGGDPVFGTADRVRTVSAGLVGFRSPAAGPPRTQPRAAAYAKLRQVRWAPADGGHRLPRRSRGTGFAGFSQELRCAPVADWDRTAGVESRPGSSRPRRRADILMARRRRRPRSASRWPGPDDRRRWSSPTRAVRRSACESRRLARLAHATRNVERPERGPGRWRRPTSPGPAPGARRLEDDRDSARDARPRHGPERPRELAPLKPHRAAVSAFSQGDTPTP